MRFITALAVTMMLAVLMLPAGASAEQHGGKNVSVAISTEDTLLEGTPPEFNLGQFTSRLNKQLALRLKEDGFHVGNDKPGYQVRVEIETMSHKAKPFRFKASYMANYRYTIAGPDAKELVSEKEDKSDEEQLHLIEEMVEDIAHKVAEESSK